MEGPVEPGTQAVGIREPADKDSVAEVFLYNGETTISVDVDEDRAEWLIQAAVDFINENE